MADDNAPTTRMISEEPDGPTDDPDAKPEPFPMTRVETRRVHQAYRVHGSVADAGVTDPDDAPVIVVRHSSADAGLSWIFLIDIDQARALRTSLNEAIREHARLEVEQG